jgi:hypothetical protein
MTPENLIEQITQRFEGLLVKASWGESALFYNPDQRLPNGIYFCTIKQQNGDNDRASQLDRKGVYRLSLGINRKSYEQHFGSKPARPTKGGIVDTGHDFTELDRLMPHPIYAWMAWVQVLNPSVSTFVQILSLMDEAYRNVVVKYGKKVMDY